ncbi:hypothetical protein FQN54_002381 [Arachnomyces sp. PD_36]|nr:hypothetical protein FQN54_002381 [Arachnomyces sp. PD_36]
MGDTAYISEPQGTGEMVNEPSTTDNPPPQVDPENSKDSKDTSEVSSSKDNPSDLPTSPPAAPPRGGQKLSPEEEEDMFRSLQNIFTQAEEDEGSFNVQELLASLEQADEDARRGRKNLRALSGVRGILERLWSSGSEFMARAAETLANGSRDPSWRSPYGQTGILEFFLRIVATEDIDHDIMLHSLRLVGNACADTDDNRQRVVDLNYTLPIINLFLNPVLVHVAIPVIYNICTDFEPAQSQVAANGAGYILLKLLSEGKIEGSALLSYTYELVEMATEKNIDDTPDEALSLLVNQAADENSSFANYSCLLNCLLTYLQNERFQAVSINNRLVEGILSVLHLSYDTDESELSSDETKLLAQLRLSINQSLSDISALPQFSAAYPLGSPLINILVSWLENKEDQLQICSCVMLGNLARSDDVCESMVRDMGIHKPLVSILCGDAKGSVLHAALGILKNLSIAGDNRRHLGDTGAIPAASRLWAFDTVPQVQFSAASLTRQMIVSSLPNISRLLEPLSTDPDSPAYYRTYLSLLLSLFFKTDSTPIKTEIGRTVAAVCRKLNQSKNERGDSALEAHALLDRLFRLHEDIAHPIGVMITQTEWPVVQSEGWFALALIASTDQGARAVVDCIMDTSIFHLLDGAIKFDFSSLEGGGPEQVRERERRQKDRDNIIILINGMLKHNPATLSQETVVVLQDLMRDIGREIPS